MIPTRACPRRSAGRNARPSFARPVCASILPKLILAAPVMVGMLLASWAWTGTGTGTGGTDSWTERAQAGQTLAPRHALAQGLASSPLRRLAPMPGLTASAVAATLPAEGRVGILAVVNDEAITAFDLDQRLNLIIRTSDLPDTGETRESLAPQVLRGLVDERLKLQEARRLGIQISDADLRAAYATIEQQIDLPEGGLVPFLEARAIAPETLEQQIRAELAWQSAIMRRLGGATFVPDEEIDSTIERLRATEEQTHHLLAEIFLPVDSPAEEARVLADANRLIDELRRGADFPSLARQFSQSASAQRSGDLGWVPPGQLDPELDRALEPLEPGDITPPVRTRLGYSILLLRDRSIPAMERGLEDTTVTIAQVILPLADSRDAEARASQRELAAIIRETVEGCADFEAVGIELRSPLSGVIGRVSLAELPEDLRAVVSTLDLGVASSAMEVPDGLRLIMVCDRDDAVAEDIDREQVQDMLFEQQMAIRANQYLRDLRQQAFLDIRF